MSKKDFDNLLLQAVDEVFSAIGESSTQAIYFHLEKGFKIKKHEIPYKIEDFAGAIEKIFGLGANFLEILIMKRLYEKVGQTVQLQVSKDFTFTKYIATTKRSFLKKRNAEEFVQCDQIAIKD